MTFKKNKKLIKKNHINKKLKIPSKKSNIEHKHIFKINIYIIKIIKIIKSLLRKIINYIKKINIKIFWILIHPKKIKIKIIF
jgi:hypothetical protein